MSVIDSRAVEEYNAFGPWIDEAFSGDDVPPLFADFAIDFDRSRVLKFPRGEARRDLEPGMHLYNVLMIIAPERLVVLTRDGDRYTEATVEYGDVIEIADSVDLLDGRLSFQTTDGVTFAVPYNGSSRETVAELVDFIRAKTREAAPEPAHWIALPAPEDGTPLLLAMDDLGKRDVALVSLFNDVLRADDDVRLIAALGRRSVMTTGGIVSRIAHLFRPMTLHGMVLCGVGTELQVLSRRTTLVRGGRPETSLMRTVVAADQIDSVTERAHPGYTGVSVLTVSAGAARVEFVVPADSPTRRALLAL